LQRIASIFTGHDLNDFIDVCSIANISVFILDVPCHFCIFFVLDLLDISLSYFVLNQPTLKSQLDNSRVDMSLSLSLSLHAPCAPDADAAAHCLCPFAGSHINKRNIKECLAAH